MPCKASMFQKQHQTQIQRKMFSLSVLKKVTNKNRRIKKVIHVRRVQSEAKSWPSLGQTWAGSPTPIHKPQVLACWVTSSVAQKLTQVLSPKIQTYAVDQWVRFCSCRPVLWESWRGLNSKVNVQSRSLLAGGSGSFLGVFVVHHPPPENKASDSRPGDPMCLILGFCWSLREPDWNHGGLGWLEPPAEGVDDLCQKKRKQSSVYTSRLEFLHQTKLLGAPHTRKVLSAIRRSGCLNRNLIWINLFGWSMHLIWKHTIRQQCQTWPVNELFPGREKQK